MSRQSQARSASKASKLSFAAVAFAGQPVARTPGGYAPDERGDSGGLSGPALARFGAPVAADDFEQYDGVLQLGVARIGGVAFADAWEDRTELEVEGRKVPVLGLRALIENKRFAGRTEVAERMVHIVRHFYNESFKPPQERTF